MPSRPPSPPDHARLLTLLLVAHSDVGPFSFATDETLALARALDVTVATQVVSAVLGAYAPGGDHGLAERAAHVAHALGLAGAVPALVACVERLPPGDPVTNVARAALELIGRPAVGPLVEAFRRANDPEIRFTLGATLASLPRDGGRVRAALEGLLADDPDDAAQLLGAHGDPRAVSALRATLDGLAYPAPGAGELDALERIVSVGEAIRALGGKLTRPQRGKYDRACARADALVLDEPDDPDAEVH